MFWINFLHFYQPPSMGKETIDEVTKRSYFFIIKILKESRKAKIVANINASLLEHLEEWGYHQLIFDIYKLAQKGKIELTLSAAYHPVLPLVPYKEAIRQIKISQKIYKRFFPQIKIKGFFFPEMVYDKKVAQFLPHLGIKWIILDEISLKGQLNQVNYEKKYIDQNSGLNIVFRSRKFSNGYPPKIVLDFLKESQEKEPVIISATDAELYGDRHVDREGDFYWALRSRKIKPCLVNKYLKSLKKEEKVVPYVSSWDTQENELKKGESLFLWQNPKNKIHKKLWELTNFALKTVEKNRKDKNYKWARLRLDRGLSSCVYWWASDKKVGSWGSPAWHPDQVIIGAKDLVRSVRSLEKLPLKQRLKAEKLYLEINKLVWEKHWKKRN